MAKTALRVKQARKPKFPVRAYTRCQRCGRPKAVYRKFGLCRICLREMAHRGELPGITKTFLVMRRLFAALRRCFPDNRPAFAGYGRGPGPSMSGKAASKNGEEGLTGPLDAGSSRP